MIQEEQHNMTKYIEEGSGGAAFAVWSTGSEGMDKSSLMCTVCNRGGHDSENCFQVVGYQERWLEKNKVTNGSGSRGRGGRNSHRGGRNIGGNDNCWNMQHPSAYLAWAESKSSAHLTDAQTGGEDKVTRASTGGAAMIVVGMQSSGSPYNNL